MTFEPVRGMEQKTSNPVSCRSSEIERNSESKTVLPVFVKCAVQLRFELLS
jgi:hypothetical protein